ncbi:hypothetical protein RN607_03505 [Demequina capsici]|uniref:Uncharacterized protein n=1 Tax=Demequina capsici TaxID=3075620 RepID=A0AA96F852_9MICO|nr:MULTISPECIES: hypothetical protein [unclassified Demequina]WNM25177.1 hypothetical protein RN606_03245 [Demequina sp. OYTSA14]WNM28081.1 hypothetical protein RN607_03505 [Demequina sp. PMTSA13]
MISIAVLLLVVAVVVALMPDTWLESSPGLFVGMCLGSALTTLYYSWRDYRRRSARPDSADPGA